MDSQVQEIKDKLHITEIVGQYVQLHKAGRTFTARCPFHKEKTPSFHVSPERGTYICFGCGERGDVFSFVQKMENIDFPAALKQLAERAGVVLKRYEGQPAADKGKDERLFEVCEAATLFFESAVTAREDVRAYLANRGVNDESKKTWRLGYAPAAWHAASEHLQKLGFSKDEIVDAGLAARSDKRPGEIYDRFRGRIMFPIANAQGRIIAFSGRYFEKIEGSKEEGEPAKYVNSSETALFKKSRTLYGFDKAKNAIRKADCILLVEGQFDLVLAHQSGLPFTVALSGTALTPEHLSLLGRFSKRLVLALDGDAAGVRAGLKSTAMAFAAGFDVKIPTFPQGQDPADIAKQDPEALRALIRQSKTAVEFFLDTLRPQARDERGYKKLVEVQVLPLLAALQSSIEQAHFVHVVAERLHVPETAVRAEVLKRPKLPEVAETPAAVLQAEVFAPTPFERKVGIILFSFATETPERQRLLELCGEHRLSELESLLLPHAERLRFEFEREVGEHSTAETIAGDVLGDIERVVTRERMKQKFS